METVVYVALALAVASFVVFLPLAFRPPDVPAAVEKAGAAASAANFDKILEALAKLADSLGKASPATAAIIASMFFMLVAVAGAGLEVVAK